MIKIFIVFIFIYICLTAMALNYAKAFKVKNAVIEYLETNEIIDLSNMNANDVMTMEDYFETEFVGKKGYNVSEYKICETLTESIDMYCHPSGIVIKKTGEAQNTEGVYYTVSTYMSWGIPFINNLLRLNGNNQNEDVVTGVWTISGETRLIVRD